MLRQTETWFPVLDGRPCDAALDAVRNLASNLWSPESTAAFGNAWADSASLSGGCAGVALFFHHLHRAGWGEDYGERAQQWLKRAQACREESDLRFSLYRGDVGIRW